MHDFFSNFCVYQTSLDLDSGAKRDIKIFDNKEDAQFYAEQSKIARLEKLSDLKFSTKPSDNVEFMNECSKTQSIHRVCKFMPVTMQHKVCQKKGLYHNSF